MKRAKTALIWIALAIAITVPLIAASGSYLLEYRRPVYIVAGFAGIVAMGLLLVQPLLAGGYMPGLPPIRGRQIHRMVGIALVVTLLIHVVALWITSPPDMIDALLFVSPTPFSAWGVVAMWAVLASALLALLKRRLGLRPRTWRIGHTLLAIIIVIGSVVHALLIEGTMEHVSKYVLCALVVIATAKIVHDLRIWALLTRPKEGTRP